MEAIMITWIFYASAFMHFGYSATDIERFKTIEECEAAKVIVINELKNAAEFDDFKVVCRPLQPLTLR